MRRRSKLAAAIATAVATLVTASLNAHAAPAWTPVIFDTDMWGDIDDVFALAGLHALQDRGEAKILAVTSSTSDRWTPSYIDLINTFYDHPDIPIGLVRNGVAPPARWAGDGPVMAEGAPMYTEYLSRLRSASGAPAFPHDLKDGSKAVDAVVLLRKTLTAQPDGSVVMIGVGFGTNFARLLESKPDLISPLSGADLIRRKSRLLVLMAGRFADARWAGEFVPKGWAEYNVRKDVPSARRIFAEWPTPIIVSPAEVGFTLRIKGADVQDKFNYISRHPVAVTYRYMDATYRADGAQSARLHDHKTFDLTAVLYAIRPNDGYFTTSSPGRISVAADGVSTFVEEEGGRDRYLIISDDQRARTLEAMTSLISQPSRRSAGDQRK